MKNLNPRIVERQFHKNSKKTNYLIGRFGSLPAYIILIIALVLSYLAFVVITANIKHQRSTEFNKAVQSIISRVENLKQTELGILTSMHGLYDILPQVTKDYFEIYGTVPLETYKSIHSISYIIELDELNRNTFLFDQYSIGYYYYEIKPKGTREKYYLVQMMVPFANYDEQFLGYDIKTIEELAAKFEYARDSRNITCTDFIKLPLHNNQLTAFIFAPIFHSPSLSKGIAGTEEHFNGVLALEINVHEFIKEALRGGSASNNSEFPSDATVFFDVFEYKNKVKHYIFSSKNRDPKYDISTSEVSSVAEVQIADKKLEFNFYSDTFIGGFKQKYIPYVILILSLIASFILFGFVRSVIINHSKLQNFARKVFSSEKSILDNTSELIISLDYNGELNLINKTFAGTFGVSEDADNITLSKYLMEEESKNEFNQILVNNSKESNKKYQVKMKDQDGNIILVDWTIIFFDDDRQINMIGRII
jgi:PAS domain-containing protein